MTKYKNFKDKNDFYKNCELCSNKISKIKSYIFNKDFGIYTLKCNEYEANYQVVPRFLDGILVILLG